MAISFALALLVPANAWGAAIRGRAPRFVRVRDRAANVSRWRPVSR